ncbi:hypothetical protein JCM3765_002353 [Sporobolomyces pararoseus]
MSTDTTRSFPTAPSIWTRLPNETSSNHSPTPSSPSSHSSPRPTQSSSTHLKDNNLTSNLNTGSDLFTSNNSTSTSTSTTTSGDLLPPSASERLQSLRTRLSPSPSRGVPSIAFEPSSFSPSPPTPSSPRGPSSSFSPRPPGSNRSASFGAYDTSNYRTSFTQALSANSSPFSPPLSSSALTPSTNLPPHSTTTTSSSSSSTQPLLAEIFSGRPRPHFRSSTSYSSHSHSLSETTNNSLQPPTSPSSTTNILNDLTTTTTTTTTTPSYFAAPPSRPSINRARSQSSAPTFDSLNSTSTTTFNTPIGGGGMSFGAPGSGLGQSFAGGGGGGADQHGWRPSNQLGGTTSSNNHFSASLPTTSAVGSPTFSSFINLGGRDQSHSPSRSNYSPFARPNSSLSSGTGTGTGTAGGGGISAKPGAFLSQSFTSTTGWEEFEREREGRARVRDTWGATTTSGSSVGGGSLNTTPGTGLSPFSRDSSRLTEETNTSDLPSIGGGDWGSSSSSAAAALGPGGVYKVRRDYSLGAVGSGRKRSDSAWGGTRERILREQDEDDENVAPPTKSGATSRRHSFAAFEVPFRSSSSSSSNNQTIGFHLPQEVTKEVVGNSSTSSFGSISNGLRMGGMGSSAIDDDDLAADLNSLHLSLDAHAKEQQERASSTSASTTTSTLHVGSMPVDFPPARSRRFDSSRSPESKPSTLLSSTSPQPPVSLIPGSPRATAEPFTPSATALVAPPSNPTQTQTRSSSNSMNPSTSVASRFFSAPSPLPPTTTNAVATATPGGGGPSSRFDFFGMPSSIPPPPQQQQQRFGLPPPPLNHQQGFYAPQNRGPPPPPPPPLLPGSNFRGPPPPPPPIPGSTFSPFAPSPYQSPSLQHPPPPPPHMMNIVPPSLAHLNQQSNYFSAVPPPPQPPSSSSQNQNPSSSSNNNNNNSPALTSQSQSDMSLGRGVPLHSIPPESPLCIIGFKAGRKDLFFCEDPNLILEEGDLVIVEADRGRDVGKYLKKCSIEEVHKFQQHMVELALGQLANPASMTAMGFGPGNQQMNHQSGQGGGQGQGGNSGSAGPAQLARMTKECQPKRIYAKAGPADTHALLAKAQDEVKALQLVRGKVAQKGLPMEILDAEWQWDRRKLTFYYTSDQRVDFRELVRELFRIWKTRVWLCCLDQQGPSLDFV